MARLFTVGEDKLISKYDREILWIEAWGKNGLRVRATLEGNMPENDWALLPKAKNNNSNVGIEIDGNRAAIRNGNIYAVIEQTGDITFYNNENRIILKEYTSRFAAGLRKRGREFQPIPGGSYRLTVRFESEPNEKLYGMGQYQQPYLNLKGCALELAHGNTQSSVPFLVSNIGYGFLWNNPAIGRVVFGKNITEWEAFVTKTMDYWITAGNNPAEILEQYMQVTGTPPMMPDYAMGFWQSKLRYRNTQELMDVAYEYKRRSLPLDVIVIDFFHWPHQGDWKFDEDYWPNPEKMVEELRKMGIEVMVSVWPTVEKESENYEEMFSKGLLMSTDRGPRVTMQFINDTLFVDMTNPEAREFMWGKVKENYFLKGIKMYWLDEAEPEFHKYEFDNYRYYLGTCLEIGNIYPLLYAKTFYDGLKKEGIENIINLIRCAWAGAQRYGVVVWSGDIASTFESLRNQVACGLNMAMAGIPWWTSDIGGFYGGDPEDPSFRELIIRWFQFGAFCPVFRLHGDRKPYTPPTSNKGGGKMGTGGPNEVWSYGEEAYEIFKKYLYIREKLKPYIKRQMLLAHEKGTPIMRPLFYDFPFDTRSWEIEDEFMFGPDILVAPILYEGVRERTVYLPEGAKWYEWETGKVYEGGKEIICQAPLNTIPVFIKNQVELW